MKKHSSSKAVAFLLAATLLASSLAGCGGAASSAAAPAASAAASAASAASAPAETTETNVAKAYSGTYVGAPMENGTVAYKGIQYATAERWQAPVVVPASEETIQATEFGSPSNEGAEDCLNLVVWSNPESTNPNKSVFMWQYGSAQLGGTNSRFDWSEFVKANPDIIVVTPNHRGGFWGSIDLSTLEGYDQYGDAYAASNNLARLDLLACLQWINQNIAAFGGNPEDVTIGGHSSGSNNVTCLLLMEEAHPYFQKAACQASFSCDISLETEETAEFVSQDLFSRLGVSTMEELLALPIETINEKQAEIQESSRNGSSAYTNIENKLFSPVIDNVVIHDDYYQKLLDGGVEGKTLMFGNNAGEYDQQFVDWELDEGTNWDDALNFTIEQNWGKLSDRGWNAANAQAIIDEYFSHNEEYGRNAWVAAKDLKNDLYLRCGSLMYVEATSRYDDVYTYFLDWDITPDDNQRASHGSENNIIARQWAEVPEDMLEDAAMISDTWAAFIQTGNPNNPELGAEWVPYNGTTHNVMYLSSEPHMVEGVRQDDVDLLLPLMREYPLLEAAKEADGTAKAA